MKYLKNNVAIAAILASSFPVAYDPGKGGWKLDDDGKIELKDGNPIYVTSAGDEQTIEFGTIARLNSEAKSQREAKEAAETKLKTFDGIDPKKYAAGQEAIDKLKNIDQKKLIDAGEVEKVREEISKNFTDQLTEKDKEIGTLTNQVNSMQMDTAFSTSEFVRDNIAVPAEMFKSQFSQQFKNEDGKLIGYDATGNKIFSKKRAGEVADFDEAIEIIVDAYPNKDAILKADNQSGSGNNGDGGNRPQGNTMKRSQFDELGPIQQAEIAQKGEVRIVD